MASGALTLYSYFRSSCSHRVRIALNLKGLEYEYKAVNLLKGEQFSPEFTKLNPIGYVPVLVDEDIVISDSFAICLYLDEKYPQHPLLPHDLQRRAINYQAANIVSSSIQPLQNLGILKYIEEKVNPDEKLVWVKYHIGKGVADLDPSNPVLREFTPACVVTCAPAARYFGDLDNPNSNVRQKIAEKRGTRLLDQTGNRPQVYYLSGEQAAIPETRSTRKTTT